MRPIQVWTRYRWPFAVVGTVLYVLRLALEAPASGVGWGVAATAACLAAVLLGAASGSPAALALCWLYVLWPTPVPTLALGVAFISLAAPGAVLLQRLERRGLWALDGLLLAAALGLYGATLAPTILPADSGEFQIVGPLLGVAHPPGFALFTMLARLFALLPWGEMAWRVNLMGAVTGALTLVIVARAARRLTGAPWAGLAAAGALGLSTTFWAQSTTANIRSLTMFFTALSVAFALALLDAPPGSRPARRALLGLAAAFGLLIAHHAWPAFFAPVFLGLVLWHDPRLLRRPREWLLYLLAFALPFLSDLYILIRAWTGAPFGTDDLVDLGRVADHLLGRGFAGDMFAYLRLDRVLWERTLVVGDILHFQFGAPLLLLAALGLAWLVWRRPKAAFLLGGIAAVMAFIVATYRAPQSVEYLMPAYVPVALCIGCAAAWPLRAFSQDVPAEKKSRSLSFYPLLAALCVLPILYLGLAHLPSYLLLHHDRSARTYAEGVLLAAPPGAHILSNWHWYTPLRYLQLVEGRRADVEVTYIYPQGATAMPEAWPQRITAELARDPSRPLVVTNYYPTYQALPYRFEPLGEAFLVRSGSAMAQPAGLTPLDVELAAGEDRVQLIGYRLAGPLQVQPGEQIAIDLAWQPLTALDRGYSFFVQLLGPDGVPVGQSDRQHAAASTYTPGEVLLDRHTFPVFVTALPGTYRLIAGAYYVDSDGTWTRLTSDDGAEVVSLPVVEVQPASLPAVTMHTLYQPFGRTGPLLTGMDIDDTSSGVTVDGLLLGRRVYLHWRLGSTPAVAQVWAAGTPVDQASIPAGQGYITLALDVPSGTQEMSLVLLEPDGTPLSRRGAWGLPLPSGLSLYARRQGTYVPFGGKLALVGAQVSQVGPNGGTMRVRLCFLGQQPIVDDYIVTVGGPFLASSDSVPALGAIPTFKWVRGSLVSDVHLLAGPGTGHLGPVTVGVYDAFTGRALPPLDERIVAQGLLYVPLPQGRGD